MIAWLASYRLRILFRTAFLLLAVVTLAMALHVLQEEKQRGVDTYQGSFTKTKEQIAARLRHPSGQLALLNPPLPDRPGNAEGSPGSAPVHPVVLPFSAIDFDDQTKVRHAVEMAGCLVQYPHYGSLCVAVGNNPWAGGFIYAAGTFASGELTPHRIGDEYLDHAHRLRLEVSLRGQTYRWVAPFEPLADPGNPHREGVRGRFTGYVDLGQRNYHGARPLKEFRGWIWQSAECLPGQEGDHGAPAAGQDCLRRSFFSLRLPVEVLQDALFHRVKPQWPPADLDRIRVHVAVLPPGDGAPLFDSDAPGAVPPFSLNDLQPLLLPGERLIIRRAGAETNVIELSGRREPIADSPDTPIPLLSGLLGGILRRLPVDAPASPEPLEEDITTPLGTFRIILTGDARSVVQGLSLVAARLAWYVLAMLGALTLAWLVIEVGMIRPIARLTRRARGLSPSVQGSAGLTAFDFADLRGGDEMGILATCLNDLLRRVKEDAEREQIRAAQEKDMWHAVGHEIMSPLQSLMALHAHPEDPSQRYIQRMQQAVRILYGSASPSEAFQSSTMAFQVLDLDSFLRNVAENAACVGISGVTYRRGERAGDDGPVLVRADEYALEDVLAHILRNGERFRTPGTPLELSLTADEHGATLCIRNQGPHIDPDRLERIFEYGVSDPTAATTTSPPPPDADANAEAEGALAGRGQGLFVARTYMAKMGGTVVARNEPDGVAFVLTLPRHGG